MTPRAAPDLELLGRAGLLRRLEGAPARVSKAAEAAGEQAIEPAGWTAQQVVLHLVAVETAVFQRRLQDLAEAHPPCWSWVEPGPAAAAPGETIKETSARFAGARAARLAWVSLLDEADWQRAGHHATLGRLDVTGLLALAADHDAEHLQALARLGRLPR